MSQLYKKDLEFSFPEDLVALEPQEPCRIVMWQQHPPNASYPHIQSQDQTYDQIASFKEISKNELLDQFQKGDVLVINNTKVEARRVFSGDLEILFVQSKDSQIWEVLLPARGLKIGALLNLPGDREIKLIQKGLPQRVEVTKGVIDQDYFRNYGELALPPYIQKARKDRHSSKMDSSWYQTEWAQFEGSTAAPTASLHFKNEDFEFLKSRGVEVCEVTLHVGLGTFLPVKVEVLSEHSMHAESVSIPKSSAQIILEAQKQKKRIWALGTTVTRALESWAAGLLIENSQGDLSGETQLFITPGYDFKIVTDLMTNFHQPGSTLIALVAGFAGLDEVHKVYRWAIQNKMRLFSYGDLSVWRQN